MSAHRLLRLPSAGLGVGTSGSPAYLGLDAACQYSQQRADMESVLAGHPGLGMS